MPDEPEALGLVALLLLHDSRAAARYTPAATWCCSRTRTGPAGTAREIGEAVGLLDRALRHGTPGPYQLQAAIAALHARAPAADRTDWPRIAALYAELLAVAPSPVVALNHAVAVAMATAPADGLALVDAIDGLDRYHLLHAARADLLRRLGRRAEDAAAPTGGRTSWPPTPPTAVSSPPDCSPSTSESMRLSILDNGHRRRARLFLAATARLSRVDSPDIVQDAAVPAGVPHPAAAGR